MTDDFIMKYEREKSCWHWFGRSLRGENKKIFYKLFDQFEEYKDAIRTQQYLTQGMLMAAMIIQQQELEDLRAKIMEDKNFSTNKTDG